MPLQDRYRGVLLQQINITNLTDVALTLVVCLLMIAPLIEQGIDVRLPPSSPARINVVKSVVLTVAPGDVYYFGSERVSPAEIFERLRERKASEPDLSVVVKADERVPYRNLVVVLDIVKRCEITAVGLATREE